MIFKLKRNHWETITFKELGEMRTLEEATQYVKDVYKGELSMNTGFGSILFHREEHLTWFLLQCES
jgi:hypothetical protein